MISYTEDINESTKTLLELVNKFSKFAGYKINIQKSIVFLYNNKLLESKKTISPTITFLKNRAPRNKFSQGGKRPVC